MMNKESSYVFLYEKLLDLNSVKMLIFMTNKLMKILYFMI